MKAKYYNQVTDDVQGYSGLVQDELLTDKEKERFMRDDRTTLAYYRRKAKFRKVKVADGRICFVFGTRFAVNDEMVQEIKEE